MAEKVKCFIVYTKFLDEDTRLIIGGVAKYIADLGAVLSGAGYEVIVCQHAKENFTTNFRGFTVAGIKSNSRSMKDILAWIDRNRDCGVNYERDILIFATDIIIIPSKFKHVIAINHGIAWDDADFGNASPLTNYAQALKCALRAIVKTSRYQHCNSLVCVDYNFINWYRTQVKAIPPYIQPIPNYTDVPASKPEKDNSRVSIIFSRRLESYRGTRLFADSAASILRKYPNVSITIAGTGPDEKYMRSRLGDFPSVKFTSYSAEDSVKFHSSYDIAVVPTVKHEAISLSLLEAMAAGCAVIASNIGGITNAIIDGFNGLMISPVQSELEEALERLITSPELRQRLSDNAYQTVREGFSFTKWAEKWLKVVDEVRRS